MKQQLKFLSFLIPGLLTFGLCMAQKKAYSGPGDEGPEERKPDLKIVSVSVVYPQAAKPITLNTARGTVQGNPNSAAANPLTQCTVVIRADSAADDEVMVDVTLPVGVKIQQAPPNASTGPCADYHMQCDGAIHLPLGHLTPGQTVTTQFTYSTPPTGGSLRNAVTVHVKGSRPESNMSNNSGSATLH
ncbi:MAG: hypothetical protein Q8927_19035 [Bacteroidota bacterium]|nr:hypothetical protein [Bacteroidota bacterium]MDP4248155.1 hypothetical protein [Bacteroidota bacterium]MDP4256301.1 hypothetical protein [Bacteroidota bacterium]